MCEPFHKVHQFSIFWLLVYISENEFFQQAKILDFFILTHSRPFSPILAVGPCSFPVTPSGQLLRGLHNNVQKISVCAQHIISPKYILWPGETYNIVVKPSHRTQTHNCVSYPFNTKKKKKTTNSSLIQRKYFFTVSHFAPHIWATFYFWNGITQQGRIDNINRYQLWLGLTKLWHQLKQHDLLKIRNIQKCGE